MARASSASVSSQNAGMADTGTEMSCLMFRPSSTWASGMLSRMCQSWCAWVRLSATTASRDAAFLQRRFEQALELRAGMRFGFVVGVFQQHAERRVCS